MVFVFHLRPKFTRAHVFLKVFNGCPLGINGTATWIHPETRDQHILIAAEEGLYTLNQLHVAYVHLLYPRRTIWMVVAKGLAIKTTKFSSNNFTSLNIVIAISEYIHFRKNVQTQT
jgi:hypothetical protein